MSGTLTCTGYGHPGVGAGGVLLQRLWHMTSPEWQPQRRSHPWRHSMPSLYILPLYEQSPSIKKNKKKNKKMKFVDSQIFWEIISVHSKERHVIFYDWFSFLIQFFKHFLSQVLSVSEVSYFLDGFWAGFITKLQKSWKHFNMNLHVNKLCAWFTKREIYNAIMHWPPLNTLWTSMFNNITNLLRQTKRRYPSVCAELF